MAFSCGQSVHRMAASFRCRLHATCDSNRPRMMMLPTDFIRHIISIEAFRRDAMPRSYDLVVIGTGTAASPRIAAAPRAGASRSSTTFRSAAPVRCAAATRKRCWSAWRKPSTMPGGCAARVFGGREPVVDWPGLIVFKRSFTAPVPQRHEEASKADFDL